MKHAKKIEAYDLPCPRCGEVTEAAVWPYLKGGTGANGEKLVWRRCQACNALFSNLTKEVSNESISDRIAAAGKGEPDPR